MSMSVSSAGSYSFMDRLVSNSMKNAAKTEGKQFDPTQMAVNIIKKEDTDGDGKISAAESKVDAERFNRLDTDSDGLLTGEELVAEAPDFKDSPSRPVGPPPPKDSSEVASGIMAAQDADEDGSLSVEESGLSTEEYNVLDTNQDGKVSLEELQAGCEARRTEMENAMATQQASTDSNALLDSLLQTLAQNEANNAYASQGWSSQSTANQGLTVSA
jgi:Ca2+-binding EF-hand superfamily protein